MITWGRGIRPHCFLARRPTVGAISPTKNLGIHCLKPWFLHGLSTLKCQELSEFKMLISFFRCLGSPVHSEHEYKNSFESHKNDAILKLWGRRQTQSFKSIYSNPFPLLLLGCLLQRGWVSNRGKGLF